MARFERFVAARYFRRAEGREEGRRFLRFITYVAVGGVAVGVAALLLALSIVRGFSQEIEAKIVGFGAHIQVESFRDAPLEDANRLEDSLSRLEGVTEVAPVITEFVLLRRSEQSIDGAALWGTEALPRYLEDQLVEGTSSIDRTEEGRPTLIIGEELARLLGAEVGDTITAFSMRPSEHRGRLLQRPRVAQFVVRGIYETDLANFDELYVFTDVPTARTLLGYADDEVTRFDLTLQDVERADQTARSIEETYGFPVMARTIYQVYQGLFAWVNLQESIIPLVISVIIIVAAFNIVATLLMIILEKTREIGILSGMGASQRSLRRLFLWLGLYVGSIGTGLGVLTALGLALLQQRYALIPLPSEAYYMTSAPIALNPLDFVAVAAGAVVLCVLASYIPARVASRIEPLRVIRFQ
ncbi:MAG: FtsX-like permease family protein [Bacteroidetes bacterium]|nr:FtsX-like permease family protein [Bacteroidota bacterium]